LQENVAKTPVEGDEMRNCPPVIVSLKHWMCSACLLAVVSAAVAPLALAQDALAQDVLAGAAEPTKPAAAPPAEVTAAATTTGAEARAAEAKPAEPDAEATKAAEPGPDGAKGEPAKENAVLKEGHSTHGEVFNEGPRQAAYLMSGMGVVRFPVTTASEDARKYIEQGVAQLHGFWYFESERSFRQAAMLDPECAIAYWGMAMSNRGTTRRAQGFIAEAVKRKEKAGRREKLLIESFDRFINAKAEKDDEKKSRAKRYVSDLEDILIEFPEDIETKAFLCEYFWSGKRDELEMPSNLAIDAMLDDILQQEPLHPAHHYRIHLWDAKKPELALRSSAMGGMASPAIAHMWHMPGHIYSKLHRYHDAVYQQEASARVDHAHMMKDRVLPDQIHNFAHNNEWCIRNMISIGRAHDAESLARNMLSLPRHPKFNHIGKSGSFKYGRQRLLDVLEAFELHENVAALNATSWMEDTGDKEEDLLRDRRIGASFASLGKAAEAAAVRERVQKQLDAEKQKQQEAMAEAEKKAREAKSDDKALETARKDAAGKFDADLKRFEKALQEIDGRTAVQSGDFAGGLDLLTKAEVSSSMLALLMLKSGKTDDAIRKAAEDSKNNPGEVLSLATQVEILFTAGKKDEAKAAFEELRKLSSTVDLDVPPMARLAGAAAEFGFGADWRVAREVPADLGARPQLDALGPFRWSPSPALDWTLPDVEEKPRSLSDYRGRPVVVVFYLGYGCLHCAEQLQAMAKKFDGLKQAGLDVVAISTDKQINLKRAYENFEGGFPFPLVADPEMEIFRKYRCYDDFEKAALHGTFLVDANGLVRWQDISYEPFMDVDFLLKESVRLLTMLPASKTPTPGSGEAE
jgi:peroxiredoxin/tetratricopeptide (TPR) repeat protein